MITQAGIQSNTHVGLVWTHRSFEDLDPGELWSARPQCPHPRFQILLQYPQNSHTSRLRPHQSRHAFSATRDVGRFPGGKGDHKGASGTIWGQPSQRIPNESEHSTVPRSEHNTESSAGREYQKENSRVGIASRSCRRYPVSLSFSRAQITVTKFMINAFS